MRVVYEPDLHLASVRSGEVWLPADEFGYQLDSGDPQVLIFCSLAADLF